MRPLLIVNRASAARKRRSDLAEPIILASQPQAWTVIDGPRDNTVSFGVPGIGYPHCVGAVPRVGLPLCWPCRRPGFGDQGWTLTPA